MAVAALALVVVVAALWVLVPVPALVPVLVPCHGAER